VITKPQSGNVQGAGKARVLIMFVGVVLVSLAPLTLILSTVPEMTPEGWFTRVLVFVILLCFLVTAGLALMGIPFISSNKARCIYLLACLGVGIGVSFYPGICQLAAGEVEMIGQIEQVVESAAKDGFWISQQSKTVTKRRVRKYDVVEFQSSSGEPVSVKLIRADVVRLLAKAKEAGEKRALRVVYLKYLKRLVLVEVANP